MTAAVLKRPRLLARFLGILALLAVVAGIWFYSRVRASLPQLEGAVVVSGLTAPVTVERDALGVPTIRGANRTDVSRALGWLHAQDRFFQMDLLRRRGAGELAELFGKDALPLDRAARLHGFRTLAPKVLEHLSSEERAQVEAYTAGVNAGLAALREKPFEYLVLRTTPRPWRAEDSVLVAYAMMLDLQGDNGVFERSLMTLRDQLGPEGLAFFAPLTTPGDAALDGSVGKLPAIPSPEILDLRRRSTAKLDAPPTKKFPVNVVTAGSNSLALGGAHTASGVGMLANDMHLNHAVPNTWYRASLEWPAAAQASPGGKVTGITLPGVPLVVAGSNERIAWGFTNAYADTSDLVVINVDSVTGVLYPVPGESGLTQIETRTENIVVKGKASVAVKYQWTRWGPIVGRDAQKHSLALRWTAHDPAAINFSLLELENAGNVADAVAIAHRAGVPTANFLVADAAGKVAWTIAGRLPKRVGFDGRLPVSWAFGDRRWDGFLPPGEVPVVIADASGRLSSANQRMLGGAALTLLGDGGYARAARGAQLRDDLAPLEQATPKDLLAIQLDDRARFLERWKTFFLETLTPAAVAQKKSRGEVRAFVEKWEGHASVDSISYRLVRGFREAVARRVLTPIFESCVEAYPEFFWGQFQYEDALWTLVHEKPAHLLNPEFTSWEALLVAAADDVTNGLDEEHVPLAQATWGQHNRLRALHPFSYSLPGFLAAHLNLPPDPLPGDVDLPRVQTPGQGASERFVVSPGREAEGIFHMPGGQSGHPLSPYFRAGHEAWARGEPTPFLPGKTAHTLTLQP